MMKFFQYLCFLLTGPSCIFCSFVDYSVAKNPKINRIQIFADYCSGKNTLSSLLQKCFPEYPETNEFGPSAFPCWYNTPWSEQFSDDKYTKLIDSEQCLFIVILRNDADWIHNMYLQPFYVDNSVSRKTFSSFIHSTWKLKDPYYQYEIHPETLKPFKNILEMRKYKLQNLLKIKSKVDNICYIDFEMLQMHPDLLLESLSKMFFIHKENIHIGTLKDSTYVPNH